MGTASFTPVDEFGEPLAKTEHVHIEDGQDDASEVPEGSVALVKKWVGYDPGRAKAALLREHARAEPRTTLIEALEHLVKESR